MVSARAFWINAALMMVKPVLHSICDEKFKRDFPSVQIPNRRTTPVSYLEAFARSLQGVAPWLELQQDPEAVELAPVARCAIKLATDPKSSQYMVFTSENGGERQPLVDAAILAQALLRAPQELWHKLDPPVKANVVAALKLTRTIPPHVNNWVLFVSLIETCLFTLGRELVQEDRLIEGLQLFRHWYLGDGWWSDGPHYAHDYYNSFVIQPALYDIVSSLRTVHPSKSLAEIFPHHRTQAHGLGELSILIMESIPRSAAHLESLVNPDGSYPPVGRSIVYRCGAFHLLSLAALRHLLPPALPPGQARTALTRVINRTLVPDRPNVTYDSSGWLRVGLVGSQPHLAQVYISQGSLYQAAAVFLPLGLPATDRFWTDPDMPTTAEKMWGGL